MTPRPRKPLSRIRAVGYVRVSSQKQADSGLSLEHQEQKIRAMATVQDAEHAETDSPVDASRREGAAGDGPDASVGRSRNRRRGAGSSDRREGGAAVGRGSGPGPTATSRPPSTRTQWRRHRRVGD
jgi:hypothetical protein